jgi:F-type H+-transporting ATPase subunit delta
MNILLLNADSSSLKCTLVEAVNGQVIAHSLADWAGPVTHYEYAAPATVESATPLPPDMQVSVQAELSRMYGPGLNTSFAHSPALIGGMRVKVGSDVYDGSVQARLATLEARF